MLAEVLSNPNSPTCHLLGTRRHITHEDLVKSFTDYKLFTRSITPALLQSKVICLPGTLAQPKFGLPEQQFRELGAKIHAIYSIGAQISLLKSYTDLKRLNVEALLDIIQLAGFGRDLTRINHLSTWSVPHLQTWQGAKRTRKDVVVNETDSTHFSPEPTNEHGYFKSRWVGEMLLTQAAQRGFEVRIYRSSAATGSTVTGIPEPADDFVRTMVTDGMVRSGYIPLIEGPDMVVDFIPVNYLASSLYKLSFDDKLPARSVPMIFHLTNPSPLKIKDLVDVLPLVREDGKKGKIVSLEEWLRHAMVGQNEKEMLQWSVLNAYFMKGHSMFGLDAAETEEQLEMIGKEVECPPMDEVYLRRMLKE